MWCVESKAGALGVLGSPFQVYIEIGFSLEGPARSKTRLLVDADPEGPV